MTFNIFACHESHDQASTAKYSHDIQKSLLERQIRLNLNWNQQLNSNANASDGADC
ncbi:MAG: hypothetical protein ACI89J_000759 [Hyphomicrobiaceae bacterium]|jgi:hypothetical protein